MPSNDNENTNQATSTSSSTSTSKSKDKNKDKKTEEQSSPFEDLSFLFSFICSIVGFFYGSISLFSYLPPEQDKLWLSDFSAATSGYLSSLLNHLPSNLIRFILWPVEVVLAITGVIISSFMWPLAAAFLIMLSVIAFGLVGVLWAYGIPSLWAKLRNAWQSKRAAVTIDGSSSLMENQEKAGDGLKV